MTHTFYYYVIIMFLFGDCPNIDTRKYKLKTIDVELKN